MTVCALRATARTANMLRMEWRFEGILEEKKLPPALAEQREGRRLSQAGVLCVREVYFMEWRGGELEYDADLVIKRDKSAMIEGASAGQLSW